MHEGLHGALYRPCSACAPGQNPYGVKNNTTEELTEKREKHLVIKKKDKINKHFQTLARVEHVFETWQGIALHMHAAFVGGLSDGPQL